MNIVDFSMFAVTIFSLGMITGCAGSILIGTIIYAVEGGRRAKE